jgi:uncharacterized protein (DUF983 family)
MLEQEGKRSERPGATARPYLGDARLTQNRNGADVQQIPMHVTRGQIISRGLANECPNCGGHTLFSPGRHFRINDNCGNCGLKFDRGDGFFLGPFVVNYGVTVFIFVLPAMLLYGWGVVGMVTAGIAAAVGAFVLPVLLYRRSWSWWLMFYFYFLPQKLPNNRNEQAEDQEE